MTPCSPIVSNHPFQRRFQSLFLQPSFPSFINLLFEQYENDQKSDGLTHTGISAVKASPELNKSFYRNQRLPSSADNRPAYIFLLRQHSLHEERPVLPLTGEETSRLVELVGGRKRTVSEAIVHGTKDGIDKLIGNWNKSHASLISGEDPASLRAKIAELEKKAEDLFECSPKIHGQLAELKKRLAEQPANPRLQSDLDFIRLQSGIGDATYGSRWILEGIAARNPHCKGFAFKATKSSLGVSGPAFLAEITIVPSTAGSNYTFTVRYDSVQNGWPFRIPAVPLSESSIYLMFERLAHSLLNHVSMRHH